ncbi:hypothetical protein KFK09_019716 [Dendrobium nobile]|uniref:Uncharacterized protein n=1 Tax=Dendrobium nobile TaxID=94219 RepID=A0A8T3ART9_DENNO|nr:hypothetical protein KFK09_019716 [Dendrobium nobile]
MWPGLSKPMSYSFIDPVDNFSLPSFIHELKMAWVIKANFFSISLYSSILNL